MFLKCPGQDTRNIRAETVQCPNCAYRIEIFSDEVKISCPKCKSLVCRERLPFCVDWCKYAQECVGEEKWKKMKGG